MAVLGSPLVIATGIKLSAGTQIRLELQQTVSSAYTAADSTIYFRVVDDLNVADHVLVRQGTLVTGKMIRVQERQRAAQSGSFAFDVHLVPAVDGQNIRIFGSMARSGGDRDAAYATNVMLFGAFGLLTHGANAWAIRGTVLPVEVISDRIIDVDRTAADTEQRREADFHGAVAGHKFDITSNATVKIDLEKSSRLGDVYFDLRADPALGADQLDATKWQIDSIDGAPLPAPILPIGPVGQKLKFDSWSILQYCHDGENRLRFTVALADGRIMDATDTIVVIFR
ncbi:MAG TPA: hypothetical protein VF848_07755 [Steroidobacteraceae bacterium]